MGAGGSGPADPKPPLPQEAAAPPRPTFTGRFEPADAFAGPRPGMAFKAGPLGVGYYGDGGGAAVETVGAPPPLVARRPAVWQLVADNVYIHRHAKALHDDDVMLCACPAGGGCGASCINRTLNVECVAPHCAAGRGGDCGNQAFVRKRAARIESRRAGAKGFGLFAVDAISKGSFITEYVGEVLEEEEYARRKSFYAEVGRGGGGGANKGERNGALDSPFNAHPTPHSPSPPHLTAP